MKNKLLLAVVCGTTLLMNFPVWSDTNGDQAETPSTMNQAPVADTPKMTKNGIPKLIVEFQESHADISPTYNRTLDMFGHYLKVHPGARADIAAYADHTGHGPANALLAQKRADAVAMYLTANYGIGADRIKAQGYGEVSDKLHNDTLAGRQAARTAYGRIINS